MTHIRKQLTPIGTTELIDFPDDAIFGVPAKIDTGADYSSIWASDIMLDGNLLRFNFFAPGSPYYQQKPVETSTFKQARVKNSFGDTESRYKIKLRVRIGERTFTRWFNLADRSRSTYPVLLGKNFLKNTFLVDVSARHIASEPAESNKILALGAQKSGEFFAEVTRRMREKTEITCAAYSDLVFYLDDLDTSVLYLGTEQADIAAYGLVYFKSHNQEPDCAAAAAEYLGFRGRRFYDREVGTYTSMSKLTEYMRLTCGGIAIPKTVCATTAYLQANFASLRSVVGVPFVLKEIHSDRGKKNYLIQSRRDFEALLAAASPADRYLAQTYVPNDGFYRLYVIGNTVALAIWRSTFPHKDALKAHLNKPQGGVNAKKVELRDVPTEALQLAEQAAQCMNRQIAGVDLVQDNKTKEWYVLEVNNAPQLRSGSFLPEKAAMIAELFDKELTR